MDDNESEHIYHQLLYKSTKSLKWILIWNMRSITSDLNYLSSASSFLN
jgi:hypothetical protein